MSDQYTKMKTQYGIDEALEQSSESEADEYISKFLVLLIFLEEQTKIRQQIKRNKRFSLKKNNAPRFTDIIPILQAVEK